MKLELAPVLNLLHSVPVSMLVMQSIQGIKRETILFYRLSMESENG